jgi:hypothetical protein
MENEEVVKVMLNPIEKLPTEDKPRLGKTFNRIFLDMIIEGLNLDLDGIAQNVLNVVIEVIKRNFPPDSVYGDDYLKDWINETYKPQDVFAEKELREAIGKILHD